MTRNFINGGMIDPKEGSGVNDRTIFVKLDDVIEMLEKPITIEFDSKEVKTLHQRFGELVSFLTN